MKKEPCSNCGVEKEGAAMYTCQHTTYQQQFCIDCVTFERVFHKGVQVGEKVICWMHAGVGGAAGHQRQLKKSSTRKKS